MDTQDCFSSTYAEARAKFLAAANARGAALTSHAHPAHRGPSGEMLAVDVATLGPEDAEQVLLIVSATHGVEGHAGSGCQVRLLQSTCPIAAAGSTRLVLVHAINPYGFAYAARTNEDNVDLNRNFVDFDAPLPINEHYAKYAREYLPNGSTMKDFQISWDRLEREARARGGFQFFKGALQPGQYSVPNGLYYGGTGASWSNKTFRRICARSFQNATRVAVLDIHTGLGPCGVGEVILATRDVGRGLTDRFTPPVSIAGAGASVAVSVKGPLILAAHEEIHGNLAVCCALEFGTVPLSDNVEAMLFENWGHRCLPREHALREEGRRKMRGAYYRDTPEWKLAVLERFSEVTQNLLDCIGNGRVV